MTTAAAAPRSKGLHITLWVLQVLVGLVFIAAGAMKTLQPVDALLKSGMTWVEHFSEPMVRFIGISEFLGGVGLIVPAATRILPKLTGIAAAMLALVMALAIGFHLMHNEPQLMGPSVVQFLLTSFIAWGRLVKAPIPPR